MQKKGFPHNVQSHHKVAQWNSFCAIGGTGSFVTQWLFVLLVSNCTISEHNQSKRTLYIKEHYTLHLHPHDCKPCWQLFCGAIHTVTEHVYTQLGCATQLTWKVPSHWTLALSSTSEVNTVKTLCSWSMSQIHVLKDNSSSFPINVVIQVLWVILTLYSPAPI